MPVFLWRFKYKRRNSIFLVSCDALKYLAELMHKKYSATFVWDHPFRTYISYDRVFNPSPQVHTCTHFGWPPSIVPVAYVLNGWPISHPKKQIRTFEYCINWNIKIRKKILYDKINGSVGWNKQSRKQY